MKVKDIMVRDVVSVRPETKITDVANILFTHRFHGVPVLDNGMLVGIVTENDFFIKDSTSLFLPSYINLLKDSGMPSGLSSEQKEKITRLLNAKAKDIMSKDCVCASPDTELDELMDIFRRTNFTTIPVTTKENMLEGIVTVMDVVRLMGASLPS